MANAAAAGLSIRLHLKTWSLMLLSVHVILLELNGRTAYARCDLDSLDRVLTSCGDIDELTSHWCCEAAQRIVHKCRLSREEVDVLSRVLEMAGCGKDLQVYGVAGESTQY